MKKLSTLAVSALVFISMSVSASEAGDAAQAVNVAGSLRILSQRIVKAYCQLGVNESYGEPDQQIKGGIAFFENNMEQLKPFISKGEAAAAAVEVEHEWHVYKTLATTAPNRENAIKLFKASEQLLNATEKMVNAIQASNAAKSGALINATDRQIMLSQRMAMFHMLKLWGITDQESTQKADEARKEFVETQNRLMKEARNTPEINKNLNMALMSHKLLEHSLESPDALSYTVAMTSEKIMTMMDATASAYVSLDEETSN